MAISDENNSITPETTSNDADSPEEKRVLADYSEEELEAMDEEKRAELERDARAQARLKRDAELEELRFGLREIKTRISKMLDLQKNLGQFPDTDGKHAVSLCISALARHNDEKAIRKALNASLAYLKNHQAREEREIKQSQLEKEREERKKEREKETNKEKKKGLFRR